MSQFLQFLCELCVPFSFELKLTRVDVTLFSFSTAQDFKTSSEDSKSHLERPTSLLQLPTMPRDAPSSSSTSLSRGLQKTLHAAGLSRFVSSTDETASKGSRGREAGRERAAPAGDRPSGGHRGQGWQDKRARMRAVAAENEQLHVPELLLRWPELRRAIGYRETPPAAPKAGRLGEPTLEQTPLAESRTNEDVASPSIRPNRRPQVRFWNMDSLDAAKKMVDQWGSDKVAVLNM